MIATFMRKAAAIAVAGAALTATGVVVRGQPAADFQAILTHVGERVDQYYKRIENIICMERVIAQQIDANSLSPEGFARVLDYELHVERSDDPDGSGDSDGDTGGDDPAFVRELKKVNGRQPRANDKPGCFDPNPLSLAPLAFLMPAHQEHYVFTFAGVGKGKDANALMIDYRWRERGRPEFVEDSKGRPDCFSISLGGAVRGRVWVDAASYDVLRVEEHLASRVDVSIPFKAQNDHLLPNVVVVERYDTQIRYKPIAFQDPDETILLPQSISVLAVLHGAGSHRKQQTFSNYRRFLTRGRIVK